MSDLTNLFAPSMFFAGAGNANTPQALRQKIALAMLMQKRKAPSTFGEGLSAIGDSLGDIGMMRRIENEAASAEQAGQAARTSYDTGGGATSSQSAAPGSPPPVQAAAMSAPSPLYNPAPSATDQTPVPGDRQEGGPARGMTLRPGIQTPAPMMTAARPATPMPDDTSLPPDVVRMPEKAALDDWRAQNPLPQNIPSLGAPPVAPPGPAPGRPTVADYGQKLALAPTPQQSALPSGIAPPVVASDAASLSPEAYQQRREIGASLLRQQLGGQPSPASRGAAPQGAAPAPPAPPPQGIMPAPPATSPIQKMPPPQAAPASAVPPAGYVTPQQVEPKPPQVQTDNMQRLQNMIENAPPAQRDSVAAALAPRIAIEQAKLAQEQKIYQDKLTQAHEFRMERERQSASAAGRVSENALQNEAITKAAAENKLRAQFGNLPPEDVIKTTLASKTIAKSGADALQASAAAREAIRGGAITGIGAEAKLNVAKLFTAMGLPDKGNVVANTEVFKSAMQPVVAAILHQTSGTSQLSEGELAFAKAAAAGNISLEPKSIERLMDIIDKRSREVIKDHQTLTDAMFGRDNPQSKAMFGVEMPRSRDDDALDWATKNPSDPRAAAIRQRLGR